MVECSRCTYPSIHFFRLKITVGCRLCTCPNIHFSLDEDTLKITVGCLVCGVVCCGGVLWWCVCVVCGEAWHTHSLSLSLLPLLFPFLFLSYLSFSLFFFFFFFSCSFSYSCSCPCFLSFSLSSFFPSTHSSLPFTPTNTVQSTDQQTWRPTLRRLKVMWRTVRS